MPRKAGKVPNPGPDAEAPTVVQLSTLDGFLLAPFFTILEPPSLSSANEMARGKHETYNIYMGSPGKPLGPRVYPLVALRWAVGWRGEMARPRLHTHSWG